MGGEIWLESELGVGSTFTFTVWLGVGEAKGSGTIVPRRLAGLRALIVDDNAAAREILDDMLEGVVRRRTRWPRARRRSPRSGGSRGRSVRRRVHGLADARDGRPAGAREIKEPRIEPKPAIVMVTAFGREDVREERLDLEDSCSSR